MQQALLVTISTVLNILSLIVVVDSILSWFMSPYSPVREVLGRILQPLYNPIRRVIPPVGGMDFSPIVLLLLLQVISQIAVTVLR
jgi:YggT family protein